MRTDRVYRKALRCEDALAELQAVAGTQLDPKIVKVVMSIVTAAEPRETDADPAPRQFWASVDPSRADPVACPSDPAWPTVDSKPAGGSRPRGRTPAGRARPVDSIGIDRWTHRGRQQRRGRSATDPVERLLEDSWDVALGSGLAGASCSSRAWPRRCSCSSRSRWRFRRCSPGRVLLGLAALLVALYALASRTIKFPIGAGYVVPSYLVLVPMLLLLPPGMVPLLAARRAGARHARPACSPAARAPSGCCSRSPTRGTRSGRRSC